ncbi:MAG: hypothetical protein CO187_01720 [Zetaproteobacteria bacterium CG_4_9_14_3_um_filter_53_7]|nr:MAG: hypothetical protein CO187_01720 [Zetaproteobacteria bacterium CG_4_9_14_3_um_filter_53_7]
MYQQKQALIISQHSPACHQLSGLLNNHGWNITLTDANTGVHTICRLNPSMFIADIEDPGCCGIALLQWVKQFNPATSTTAMCRGGNTPAMRLARHAGVHGFFYLDAGGNLDVRRGLTRELHHENKHARKAHRQIPASG